MGRRENSMTHVQQGITKYVPKSISKYASASSASGNTGKNKSPSSSTGTLKRMCHGSTSPSTERAPNKRQLIPSKNNKKQKTMDTNNEKSDLPRHY